MRPDSYEKFDSHGDIDKSQMSKCNCVERCNAS